MVSLVEYLGRNTGSDCGYCKSKSSSVTYGMWAHRLTCEDYQRLIDRGWRRSGMYCYKSAMNETCCPLYTIKCEALKFHLSKSHKKVIKRMNKFLLDGIRFETQTGVNDEDCHNVGEMKMPQHFSHNPARAFKSSENNETSCEQTEAQAGQVKTKKTVKPGIGADPTKPPCMKAKERRRLKQMEKLQGVDVTVEPEAKEARNSQEKTLEELIQPPTVNTKHNLKLRLVRSTPPSKEFEKNFVESHEVYQKYQVSVHNDDPSDVSEKQFRRFLCTSPLEEEDGPTLDHPGYGSFHQQYLLDGKIIAVGVIDILPFCVSSKYFYYDPDYAFLSLGRYSALQEAALARRLFLSAPQLKYYYMGFYIHSCPKMRYKAQYKPSFLLCPETYSWHPVETCLPKLNESKYSRLSSDRAQDSVDAGVRDLDVGKIRILFANRLCKYSQYRSMKAKMSSYTDDKTTVEEYGRLVGLETAYKMALYRD